MFIILKKSNEKDEILNIFYGQDEHLTSIRSWIKEYMEEDINNRRSNETQEEKKQFKEIIYKINDGHHNFELIKSTKAIKKGYVYNVSEKITNVIYSINILECNSNKIIFLENSKHFNNINREINDRVLKHLDKESLYQVLQKIQTGICTKKQWNTTEYNGLVSETIKTFKKDMYSSIAKKMKRFGKKNFLQIPTTATLCKIPIEFANKNQFCKIESFSEKTYE